MYNENDILALIDRCEESWDGFDSELLHSFMDQLGDGRTLTDAQDGAIENIERTIDTIEMRTL